MTTLLLVLNLCLTIALLTQLGNTPPELPALRAACLAALSRTVPMPAQPEPWQALVPTGQAWFPGGPPPAPQGEVLFDRLRLRWGQLSYAWRLLG